MKSAVTAARSLSLLACATIAASASAQDGRSTCVEHVPPGATRPTITESFPDKGFAGYAQPLTLTVTHGKGESVLPEGFRTQTGGDATKALAAAGFALPDVDGGAGPVATVETTDAGSITKLTISFVPLPQLPGRVELVLPPVPVAVARASGELVTVCTSPHVILVEEPIANIQNPKVMPNPEPRSQREEWVLAKWALASLLLALVLSAIAAWLIKRQLAKPKPVVVVPPRLPWLVALDELAELRSSTLLSEERFGEYFDRVSDSVRKYLGARYGFDGLETTSDEMRGILRRVRPPVPELGRVAGFLGDCDLVKFARQTPTEKDCLDLIDRGEAIVRLTTPKTREETRIRKTPPPPLSGAGAEPPSATEVPS